MQKQAVIHSLKITIPYLLIGVLYIAFSDKIVHSLSLNDEMLAQIQTLKGWGFILLTSIWLFVLLHRYFKNLEKESTNLKTSEEKWRSLVTNSPDYIALLDKERRFLFVNKYPDGFSAETVIGDDSINYFSDEYKEKFKEIFQKCFDTKTTQKFEVEAFGDNHSSRHYEEFIVPLLSDTNEITFLVIARDITERKTFEVKLMDSEERWRTLVSSSPDFIALLDKDSRFLYLNKYADGFNEEIVVGQNCADFMDIKFRSKYIEIFKTCLENKTTQKFEFEAYGNNKSTRYYEEYLVPLLSKNKEITFLAIARDISDRKKSEIALKESEEKYRALIDNTQEAIYIAQDGKIKYVNRSALNITGRTESELLEHDITEFVPEEDIDFAREHHFKLISGEITESQTEYRLVHSEGKNVDLLVNSVLIQWEDKPATLNFASDITERKQFEIALKQSEEKYRSLSETAKDIIIQYSLTGEITYLNPAGMEYLDYLKTEPTKSIYHFIPEKYHKQLKENAEQRVAGFNGHRLIEIEIIGRDNKTIPVEVNSTPIFVDGKIIGMISIVRDITERKEAEAELILAHSRLRQFVDSNIVGVIIADANGSILESNDYYLDMIGYTRQELEEGKVDWKNLTPPEWLFKDEIALKELEEKGTCTPYEKEYIKRDGTRVSVYLADAMLPGKDKKIAAFAIDITERKRSESMLITSEKKYRTLFENMSEGFAYCKMIFENQVPVDFVYLSTNPRFTKLTGLKNVEGKKVSEVIPGIQKDNPELFEIYGRVSRGSGPESFETFVPGLNEWFSISVYSPALEHFIAVFTLITERKLTEIALQKNRRFLADLIENSGTLIYVKDIDGKYELVNKKWEEITSLKRDSVLGRTDDLLFAKEDAERFRKNDLEAMNSGKIIEFEEILSKENNTRYFISNKFPTVDENGRVSGVCGVSTEITERKIAEEELKQSEERYRTITENIKDVVWILDVEAEKFKYISPSVYRQRGFTVEEILEQPLSDALTAPEKYKLEEFTKDRVREFLLDPSKPTFFTDEVEQPCKNGSTIWTEIVTNYYINERTGRIEIRGVSRDINERKLIQDALKESEERFRTTLDNMLEGCQILDSNWIYTYINDAAEKQNHRPKSELLGNDYVTMWPGIELTKVYRLMKDCMQSRISHQFENEFTYPDGSVGWFDLNIQPVPEGIFILSIDITEKKKAELEILNSRENLRALYARLERIREEERINLSRELHDHLGQNLTGLKMDVAYMAKHIALQSEIDTDTFLTKTTGMSFLIDDLIKNVRKISSELRPNVLDYLGLVPAIEWYVEDFKKRTEIGCIYTTNTQKIDFNMEINSSIFRIIQEAFTNIIRHAHASIVNLTIDEQAEFIKIKIHDNGIGIDSNILNQYKSLGILGMKERTLNFNGKLTIVKSKEGGTTLTLIIPKR